MPASLPARLARSLVAGVSLTVGLCSHAGSRVEVMRTRALWITFVIGLAGMATFGSSSGLAQKICPKRAGGGITPQGVCPDPEPPPPQYNVYVLPAGATVRTGADGVVRTVYFSVSNGDYADTYSVTCSATLPAACVTVSPSSLSLAGSEQAEIEVSYRASSEGTGQVTLSASSSHASDSGYYLIEALDPSTIVPPSGLDVSENNGFNLAKEKCLTLPVGQGLVQCSDYVLLHSLPSFRTFNRDRAPTLIYNAGTAEVRPIVHSKVTFPAAGSLPDYFSVALFLDGQSTPSGEAFYSTFGMSESATETRRMSVVLKADAITTGLYPYTLEGRSWYSNSSEGTTASGNLIVINRRNSPYGVGWWLAGLERLYINSNGDALVVLGDASAKAFLKNGSIYDAPIGEYSRLVSNSSEGGWDRLLRGGGRIHYDASGRHVYTDDPNGNRTTFYYNGTVERVDSIRVDKTSVKWRFYYGSDSVLDSIADPAGRVTRITTSSARVTRIYHPDGAYRRFEYSSGRYVPYDVCDERGNCDAVTYDAMSRPREIRRPLLPGAGDAYLKLRLAQVQGVDTSNTAPPRTWGITSRTWTRRGPPEC